MQLGAPRLGRRLHALAFRESPAYPEAVYYQARFRMERFGPLAAWQFTRQHTDWSEASPEVRADWFALQAFLAARFRDFDRADQLLTQSEATCPGRPWHYVERSSVLETQEKYADALVAARKSLDIQPWFRPGVQAVAHLLLRLGRDDEALTFLTDAAGRLESGMVAAQLAALQLDRHLYAEATASIERFAELSPLIEPDVAEWLSARRADLAYLLGDYGAAATHAKAVGSKDEFYQAFAERLTAASFTSTLAGEVGPGSGATGPGGGSLEPPPSRTTASSDLSPLGGGEQSSHRRTLLPLVLTYSGEPPSAYALLGRFWAVTPPDVPADGTAADGVPDVRERRLFETAGWACREFTLTFDAAAALLRAGLPFFATLFETGFGHPRLIVGCDPLRQSLFLAEPIERKPVEAPLATVIERFGVTGPRCLVAVPKDHAAKLEALELLELPDAAVHDRLHALLGLLADLRFTDAKAALDRLTADHPGHTVTKLAAVAWAKATQHPVLMLDAADAMLAGHPHDPTFAAAKANALRELGRQADRTAFLREQGTRADADPVMMQSYAQTLLTDPHRQDEADRLLRRSVRLRPHAPAGYFLLSAHRWEHQRFDESVELHRVACCLDDREEQFAEAYVRVARATGRLSEAVKLLQQRVRRADRPTAAAVRALYHALIERGEPEFARTALDTAIEKWNSTPSPPAPLPPGERGANALADLLLFKAEMLANQGRFDAAEVELAAAKPHAAPAAWHKAAARIARTRPAYRQALGHLTDLLAVEPQNVDAQRLAVALIADTQGRTAARAYLADLCTRFPFSYPVHRLRAEFLAMEPDDAPLEAARRLLDLCPHDAWAYRQLALVYGDRRQFDDALAAIHTAQKYEPDHPSQFAVLANVLRRADRTDDALAAFRDCLRRYVDHELAIAEMVRTARGTKEKKAALRFVRDELIAQSTAGEGLVAYRDQMLQLMADPDDQEALHAELERFLDDRPDLWQSWSLVIQQLLMMHREQEAYTLAKQAVARFPLLSRLWLDLAEACRATNHADERIDALRQAVACSPGWTPVARELSDALAEQEEFDEAVRVLEENRGRTPLDPLAHGFLAERLWNTDRGEEAIGLAAAAVRHDPGYDWAWGAVAGWGERLDRPDAALELTRDLAQDRAGDARVFLKLARSLYKYDQTDEALAALDKAAALDPKNPEPYDLKAERLAEAGRFDEAAAAANPPELADDLPLILQGRAAWVEARRGNYARAIPMMQALVSVDPQYYWGWSQLAEWYNDTGKPEAYLEAAGEMIRLRPDHPVPLTMRGEAKLQTGDRDGGKEDLREALRLHPGYSPAAAILFDACLADDEWKEARAALSVLQEHMTGQEVLVKQLNYALRTDDEDAAARAFGDLCRTEGEGPPAAMQAALSEMRAAELGDRADDLMAEAWRDDEPFNPWAGLFWLDSPSADEAEPEDRLAACDAVLKHYPKFLPAHDRKAEQLARMGRYDDARRACEASGLTPAPLTLRGRAAWVEAMRGDTAAAVDQMKACLAEDPDYTWGWRQVAHWCDELGRPQECLAAAEELVRLAPGDPYAYGIRGEAKKALGDHRGAKDDYQRAFQLDPKFDAAGHQLISEQLATDDLGGASRTLTALQEHADGPLLRLRAVQVAARRKDLSAARDALRELTADTADPKVLRSIIRDAAKAMDDADWTAEADDALAAAVAEPDGTPAAAAVWAERHVAAGTGWKVGDRMKELTDRNPTAGREAALVYAWGMAVTGQPETAAATVQRFAELLRRSDDGWGRAGSTLAAAGKYPLAKAWLSDWAERDGCEPWMLRALADAHRATGNDADARQVLLDAAELADETGDELPPDMTAWLALEAALAGEAAAAQEHLGQIDRTGLPDAVRLLVTLAEAVLAVGGAGPGRAAAFREAVEDIKAAAGACPPNERPVGIGRVYQKVVSKLAAVGGVRATAWGWWQRLRPLVREG
jgi:tetratricopeptide (TPR) repeat protein